MSDTASQEVVKTQSRGENINDFIHETRAWWKVPHLRLLAWHVFTITLTSTNNGFDGSLLNGLQSLSHWANYMGNPTGHILGALSAGTIFGTLMVFWVAPWLSDKWGRKWCIFFGQAVATVGAILQGLSTNYAFFLVSRLIIGAGTAIAACAAPTLISEIAYPTHREICTFSYNICWYLGATIASIVTYGTRNIDSNWCWRIPSYLQGFFPLFQVLFIYWVPESPRYLVAVGKHDKAREVISKHNTANNGSMEDNALVDFEMNEIETALEAERLAGQTSKYIDFIKRPTFRKRGFLVIFVATMMQLSGNGLVSYYLNKVLNSIGITETSEQLLINFCLMIFNFVVSFAIGCTAGYFKRRTLFLSCTVGMLISYIIWTVLSAFNQQRNFEDKALANGVLAMIFLYYFSYDVGSNGLPFLYLTEILPYSHRTKGMNLMNMWGSVILVFNSFVNPIAMDAIEWKYYIVYCCVLAVETLVVFFFFPETSGRTLEEVAEVFGDKIDVGEAVVRSDFFEKKRNSIEHAENAGESV